MNNKLSELSKPVAWVIGTPSCKHLTTDEEYANWYVEKMSTALPPYSQEYVSAILTALRNLYAACDTGERRGNGSQQGVAMPDWGTVDSVRALLESINNG